MNNKSKNKPKEFQIRLNQNLPLDAKHGCLQGAEFTARDAGVLNRLPIVKFTGKAGEVVTAYEHEIVRLVDTKEN